MQNIEHKLGSPQCKDFLSYPFQGLTSGFFSGDEEVSSQGGGSFSQPAFTQFFLFQHYCLSPVPDPFEDSAVSSDWFSSFPTVVLGFIFFSSAKLSFHLSVCFIISKNQVLLFLLLFCLCRLMFVCLFICLFI